MTIDNFIYQILILTSEFFGRIDWVTSLRTNHAPIVYQAAKF